MSMQIAKNQHPVEGWLSNPDNFSKVVNALPTHLNAERMRRLYLTVFNNSPALKACNPASVIGCLLKSAQLGLEPDGGKLYLIPRGGECTVQIGYQGYIELARRSGQIAAIEANLVYESDDFSIAYHLDSKFEHRPNLRRTPQLRRLLPMTPKIITRAERLARRGQPSPKPVAQFRVKGGCRTCRPVPVFARQPAENSLPHSQHANDTAPASP